MSVKKVIYVILFLILATNFTTSSYYIMFIIVSLVVGVVVSRRMNFPLYLKEDYIAFSFLAVWGYGFIMGLIRGNNPAYVCSNFAGMICYVFYFYLIYIKADLRSLSKIIISAGILLSCISILRLFSYVFGVSIPLIAGDVGISSTGQLRVYFSTLCVSYSALGISFYALLNKKYIPQDSILKNRILALLIFTLATASLFFIASSKGFLLGGIATIFIIIVALYSKRIIKGKIPYSLMPIIILIAIIFGFLVYLDYFSIFEMMFNAEDSSNKVRYDQLTYLIDDINLLGNGLGAVIPGVIRSDEGPYGFELTYINLIHKFGVFSLVLFGNWIYMFFSLFKKILTRTHVFYSIIAVSALGYLFPSIGNPLLMHPSLVILNSIVLYYIRVINNEKKNFRMHGCL